MKPKLSSSSAYVEGPSREKNTYQKTQKSAETPPGAFLQRFEPGEVCEDGFPLFPLAQCGDSARTDAPRSLAPAPQPSSGTAGAASAPVDACARREPRH